MKSFRSSHVFIVVIALFSSFAQIKGGIPSYHCSTPGTRCYGKYVPCPEECPDSYTTDPKAKVCYVNCNSPHCKSQCKNPRAACNTPGSACYDPRFIGGDGVVFYFHGKSKEHFSLVSDTTLHINGRFIGHRPAGRTRDFTWIQALGILFNSQKFSLEATKAATWDAEVDHLKFSYNGKDVVVPEGTLSAWLSPEKDVKVERVSIKNSVIVTLKDKAEILVNIVPVTKEDDRIHKYKVPEDDCFVHLEVQFRFYNLSPKVDGVLGRTYRIDFENTLAKPGVAMPVLGGEDKYRTTSLLSTDCSTCIFSPENASTDSDASSRIDFGPLDCTRGAAAGYGIVCKK